MNNKANSMIWAVLIQLVLAAVIVFAIYQVSIQFVQGETYELDLQVNEQVLLAETMTARNTGIMQLHTFSAKDYTTELEEDRLSVGLGEDLGKKEQLHIPTQYDIAEQTLFGRGIRWTRSAEILRINELSAQRECPLAPIDFDTVAIVGDKIPREYLQTELIQFFQDSDENLEQYLDPAKNIKQYPRLSMRQDEDLFIRIDVREREENIFYTGTGPQNERMRCIVTKHLERQDIDVVVQSATPSQPQIHLLLRSDEDLEYLRRAIRDSFTELMQE